MAGRREDLAVARARRGAADVRGRSDLPPGPVHAGASRTYAGRGWTRRGSGKGDLSRAAGAGREGMEGCPGLVANVRRATRPTSGVGADAAAVAARRLQARAHAALGEHSEAVKLLEDLSGSLSEEDKVVGYTCATTQKRALGVLLRSRDAIAVRTPPCLTSGSATASRFTQRPA